MRDLINKEFYDWRASMYDLRGRYDHARVDAKAGVMANLLLTKYGGIPEPLSEIFESCRDFLVERP